jgi:hypothetical protein
VIFRIWYHGPARRLSEAGIRIASAVPQGSPEAIGRISYDALWREAETTFARNRDLGGPRRGMGPNNI